MKFDLFEFLKTGKFSDEIKIGVSKSVVIGAFGKPLNIVGNEESGAFYYYYYENGVRIHMSSGIVSEVGVDFSAFEYPFKSNNYEINEKQKIHQVLDLFDDLELNWVVYNVSDKSRLIVVTESSVIVIFNLYHGTIEKITYLGIIKYSDIIIH